VELKLHPDIRFTRLAIGSEQRPLLVIDNVVENAEELVRLATAKPYAEPSQYYPGLRAKAPLSYQQFLITAFREVLLDFFQLGDAAFRFSMCHYSLVVTPAARLAMIQRVPHVDTTDGAGLASIHYLFKRPELGGTAFYRHRSTGFESVNESRREHYFQTLERELAGPGAPGPGYIVGDTPLYTQIASQEGVFNRMLVYPRNILHSGSIARDFVPDANPVSGRLSINSFIN
jgi:hypothetical protein